MDLTDEEVKACLRAFELAGVDMDKLAEEVNACLRAFELAGIDVDKLGEAIKAMGELARELEGCGVFDAPEPTSRKLCARRAQRQAVKMVGAARFRQYKARESAWAEQKRTGRRRREWRGPNRT